MYIYICILIIINICSIFLYMSHISSWNIIMKCGKPPATFGFHSAHDGRDRRFSAAPKLFFRVMELIPTSAGPGHGKGTPKFGMFFLTKKKYGDLTVETWHRWDIYIYLYDLKYDLKCISVNGTEMAYIYIIIYVYTPTTCPFWQGKLWWTIKMYASRVFRPKKLVSDRKMTIESCYLACRSTFFCSKAAK